MTASLPVNLLSMFAPRDPLPFFEPLDRDPRSRRGPTIGGIAGYLSALTEAELQPPPPKAEGREERKKRIMEEKKVRKRKKRRGRGRGRLQK